MLAMRYNVLAAILLPLASQQCNSPEGKQQPQPHKPPEGYHVADHRPVDPALQSAATAELRAALASQDEVVRTHALETVADVAPVNPGPLVLPSLGDPSPLVRKAAAMTVGRLRIPEAKDQLIALVTQPQPVRDPGDPNQPTYAVQARMAAIFALHQLGDARWSHELEGTAKDGRPQIRGDTAMILELMGNTSATPILFQMMKRDPLPNIRLQAAEALWVLRDPRGEDPLIQATVSGYASDRMIGLLALSAPRDQSVLRNTFGLMTDEYPEVALVAVRATGQLGNDGGIGVAEKGAKSSDARQRSLAALAMGDIGRTDSQPILATLLKDDQPEVRLAAAAALLEIGKGRGTK